MSVGAPLLHDSAVMQLAGTARYTDDIPLPAGALHLAFGMSTIAHGTITKMDLTDVRACAGVVMVLSFSDWPASLPAEMPDCSPSVHDEPLLCTGEVHYLGQPIFLVIATSHHAARRAAAQAGVTYDALPALLTIDDALAANSRFESGPIHWAKGDACAAIARAPYVVDGVFEVGGQEHFYLEGQVAAALPLEGGDMHIYSSTQHPSEIQHKVAHALHLPMAAVRVEVRRMGGGFGGKESQGNALAIACALAAKLTQRACKMRYDRDDDMMITGKRHDCRIAYRAGHDGDGRLLGLEFTHFFRCGWAQDLSLPVADRAMLHADNCYHIADIAITSHRLKTHTQSATAFRGFGGPQGMIGIERVMDHIAHATGRDALAVRTANFYREASAQGAFGEDILASMKDEQTTPFHMPVTDFVGGALVGQLAQTADYTARRSQIDEWNAKSPILKRGLALTPVKFGISFTLTWLNQAGALVHVYQDGSVHLNHGGTEMGQGLNQKVAQVVAGVFGLDVGAIKITATDTAKVPNTSATAASSGSDLNGMAARNAAQTIAARMSEFLASKFGVEPQTVRFEDGQLSAGGERFAFAQVAAWAYQARVSLSSTGFYATPKITWNRVEGRGRPFLYFAYGAAVTEVVIDTLTGENRILRTDVLHDTGTPLNPALDIGQIEGAYVQGAGWLTMEELVWDAKGALKTHAPSTYKIPSCADRPAIFNVNLWNRPNREDTIGRSKAVGEPPFMLGISAFFALQDAVAACSNGVRYPAMNAPATSERILAAVRAQRDV